jgi:hypothetical protein
MGTEKPKITENCCGQKEVIFIRDKEAFLKQYEIMVNTSQNVTVWRQTANTFYLTLNTAILGLVLYTLPTSTLLVKLALTFMGIVFSILWFYTLDYFRKLNGAKFNVIALFEKKLPIKMFELEYNEYKNKIKELSRIEKYLPTIFLIAYILTLISFMHVALPYITSFAVVSAIILYILYSFRVPSLLAFLIIPREQKEYYKVKVKMFKVGFVISPFTMLGNTYLSYGAKDKLTPSAFKALLLHEKYHQLKGMGERQADLYAAKIIGKKAFIGGLKEYKENIQKHNILRKFTHGTIKQRVEFIEGANTKN